MTVRVAFLRAVNLGRRRVPMARLRTICEDLGHEDVWTHVNSGNVVFRAGGSRASLENALEKALEDEFGFECTTFVKSAAELRKTVAARPFAVGSGDTHFVTFLKTKATAAQKTSLEALSNDFDTLVVEGADVHWLMHGKSTDTRIPSSAWAKVLGPLSSTSRNVTMLTALAAKIDKATDG